MGVERFLGGKFGLLNGAMDIAGLSLNPALIMCGYSFPSFILIGVGIIGSLLNTRIILPFALLALIFLVPRTGTKYYEKIIIGSVLFCWLLANVAYMYIGFMVEEGIQ